MTTAKPLQIYVIRFPSARSSSAASSARILANAGELLGVRHLRLWLDGEMVADFPRIDGYHVEAVSADDQ